jgi:hypothetical protein
MYPDKAMKYADLLGKLGFERDPFATTNADEEDFLEEYFIEPPFFKAVYGDIRSPKSAIVFAPRGGGKTALKRRLEISSRTDAFMCVTYNNFPTAGYKLEDIDQRYHLTNIVRILLIATLSATTSSGIEKLTHDERHVLYALAKAHLSGLDRTSLKAAISSVKNLSDKAQEAWNNLLGPLSVGINTLLVHFGFKTIELSKFETAQAEFGDLSDQIAFLSDVTIKLDFLSVYILVDKIDENPLTGKASFSLSFVKPLLTDLQLLEMKGVAFKFFLWDLIENDARSLARPDRVKNYILQWSETQLKEMLSRRLQAHSRKKVRSLAQITTISQPVDVDELVVTLSGGSPRNIIRICKAIFDQQSELDASSTHISESALTAGIESIAQELAGEMLPPSVLKDLKKLKRTDFSVRHVYADTFRISQQAGLQKVQAWQDSGAVAKIGTRQEKRGNRPSNWYAISQPMVLKHIFSDVSALDFWNKKIKMCTCGQLLLRDWDMSTTHICHSCERTLDQNLVESQSPI